MKRFGVGERTVQVEDDCPHHHQLRFPWPALITASAQMRRAQRAMKNRVRLPSRRGLVGSWQTVYALAATDSWPSRWPSWALARPGSRAEVWTSRFGVWAQWLRWPEAASYPRSSGKRLTAPGWRGALA